VEEPSQYVAGVRPFDFTNEIQKKTEMRLTSIDHLFHDWMLDTVHVLVSRDKFITKMIN
jgi:hypothetical protein